MSDDVPAIGIDLGTTYSAIARISDRGELITMVNAEGDRVTPSVVLFDGDDVIVGREALRAITTEAEHVAACAKRDVGDEVFHKSFDGKRFPPEVIEAWILNKLRQDATAQIGPFSKAVITVPAYFDETRRKATQDAGYMAGLEVLDIINEPTAAAVAFGYQQGFLDAEGSTDEPREILVYDLGGGTFDVTVLQIRGTEFIALATDGDIELGGYDWDQRLVDLVAEQFIRQHGMDPREDPTTAGKVWRECEEAKRTLSSRSKAAIACDYRGQSMRVEVTRQQFEEGTLDLLDRTRYTADQTLKSAGLSWPQIDRVLLVGGSTRMPMVRRMLQELSGKEPDASVSADEAVAHGAALRAKQLLAKSHGRPTAFTIKNVNSHSLGVVGIDPLTGRKRNGTLIPRNTPLPVACRRTFKTSKAGQRSILVQIVEGESPAAEDCVQIGQCTVRDLPTKLPAQSPVDVRFLYRADGRLSVRVAVPGADREVATEIVRENGLSEEHLNGWRRHICGLGPADHEA